MNRYDQQWCDSIAQASASASIEGLDATVLYVVTDTEEGKVAFYLELVKGVPTQVVAGKLPRGQKADITLTVKEPVLIALWSGERTRDETFMAGDIKVEGAYNRWLDEIVPAFESDPWLTTWRSA